MLSGIGVQRKSQQFKPLHTIRADGQPVDNDVAAKGDIKGDVGYARIDIDIKTGAERQRGQIKETAAGDTGKHIVAGREHDLIPDFDHLIGKPAVAQRDFRIKSGLRQGQVCVKINGNIGPCRCCGFNPEGVEVDIVGVMQIQQRIGKIDLVRIVQSVKGSVRQSQ